jgi:hypothetical protein
VNWVKYALQRPASTSIIDGAGVRAQSLVVCAVTGLAVTATTITEATQQNPIEGCLFFHRAVMEHSMYPEGGPDAAPCRAPAELRPRQQGTTESICGADFQDGNCRVHVEQQKLRDPLNNFGSTGQDRQLPELTVIGLLATIFSSGARECAPAS